MHKVELDFHGRTLSIETGQIAKQAGGSVIVRQGDTVVLVTAVRGGERDLGFLPLTVDYIEKTYAAGKIPGGFFKREGRLSEHETLTSRLIDRPMRPLFPKGFIHEIQIVATVLSAEPDNCPDVLALCGASAAVSLSDIPFAGPIAAVRVARVGGDLVINPSRDQQAEAELNFLVAGSSDAIVMVEGGAAEVPEAEVIEALFYAHDELRKVIAIQEELVSKAGKEKFEFVPKEFPADITAMVEKGCRAGINEALKVNDKLERKVALKAARDAFIAEAVDAEAEGAEEKTGLIKQAYGDLTGTLIREMILKDRVRIGGRDNKTVRGIESTVGLLPRAHGSALFTRGETQAIVVATLGNQQEAQRIDSLLGDERRAFMLHYNFPAFSVGEARMLRGPGRREIGHGALAERAVRAVLPKDDDFSYVIRIVSEVTESNGSSSMASVCGASMALMDAGIAITGAVAGVAMGLVQEGDDHVILTDILGDEDHVGDMDFKVCGTEKGVTALQMDIKIKGLDKQIMSDALDQACEGRLHILAEMNKTISKHREEMSEYAPKVVVLKVKPDKVREIIGPGGKMIRSITETCNVKIDVEDDGTVTVFAVDPKGSAEAVRIIESLVEEPEIGRIYTGVVVKITDFGAFVEILPGTQGLLHISQIEERRIESVEDVLSEGEQVMVKVLDIDRQGKMRLSRKEALADIAAQA